MALSLECVECGRGVAASATACPNCGAALQEARITAGGWLTVAVLGILALCGYLEKDHLIFWSCFLAVFVQVVAGKELRPLTGATRPLAPSA